MLVLSRKIGESIQIGDDITVTVVRISDKVRIGIEAPRETVVMRGEVVRREIAAHAGLPVAGERWWISWRDEPVSITFSGDGLVAFRCDSGVICTLPKYEWRKAEKHGYVHRLPRPKEQDDADGCAD